MRFEEPVKPPFKLDGLDVRDVHRIRFRCPHCGISSEAAVLPGSPQVAKFRCRQCERDIEVQTRASAMDALEAEVEERKEIGRATARARTYSKSTSPLVDTPLGPAHLIG